MFPGSHPLDSVSRITYLACLICLCSFPGTRVKTQMYLQGSRQANRRALVGKMVQFSLSQSCCEICNFCFPPLGTHLQLLFFQIFSLPTSFLRTPKTWMLGASDIFPQLLRFYFIILQTFSLCSLDRIISIYLFQPTDTFFCLLPSVLNLSSEFLFHVFPSFKISIWFFLKNCFFCFSFLLRSSSFPFFKECLQLQECFYCIHEGLIIIAAQFFLITTLSLTLFLSQ